MKNIVLIVGHPDLTNSYANKYIVNRLSQERNIDIRILSSLYPDFEINIESEQRALLNSDIIILQYPLYWYSVPPILKQWMDKVFTYGFAFGKEGDKLKGKELWLSITTGGPEHSYSPKGYNKFQLEELLHPLSQTANHANMKLTHIVKSFSMEFIPNIQNNLTDVESRASKHASSLLNLIRQLEPESNVSKTM